MTKIRVLIADDHTLFRESLRSLLETAKEIEVVAEAENGKTTIIRVRESKPDIVLMDIAMPDIGGLEATRRIKEENPSVKVIMLSMYEADQYIFESLKAGASGYILKRNTFEELISAIRAVYQGESFLCPTVARKVINNWRQRVSLDKKQPRVSHPSLTSREIEILTLVAEGKSNKEIAKLLNISIRTVQTHRFNLMKKLGVHDRTQLVRHAIKEGLIVP